MRILLLIGLSFGFSGCAPKVSTTPDRFDEEVARQGATAPAVTEPARPEAPRGKGVRSGTIDRAKLVAVLDAGPGSFLRQVEVTPRRDGEKFVGWQLVQFLDQQTPLNAADLAPGDVLLQINGRPLSRPDQLQTLWDSLRTSNEVTAQLWRGDAKFELHFTIDPAI